MLNMRKVKLLEYLLKNWQYQLKALQIIFKNYPVSAKIKVVKQYLKYSGKKQIDEIIKELCIEDERDIIVSLFCKKKTIEYNSALTGIPVTSLRRKIDSLCDYIIDKI